MSGQSSLSIQYRAGSTPDIASGAEKRLQRVGPSQEQPIKSLPSLQRRFDENIIDVYERSVENAAVPDQRTGVDRRRSFIQQPSFQAVHLQQVIEKTTDIDLYSAAQQANHAYNKMGNFPPAMFSPSREKGELIDIWV